MGENLIVGRNKETDKNYSTGYDGVVKECGHMMGTKCDCKEKKETAELAMPMPIR